LVRCRKGFINLNPQDAKLKRLAWHPGCRKDIATRPGYLGDGTTEPRQIIPAKTLSDKRRDRAGISAHRQQARALDPDRAGKAAFPGKHIGFGHG
jgi:hypothetical protein